MPKKAKKRGVKNKTNIVIILAIMVIVALSIFIFKKPAITGFAVITKESTHDDDLFLVINESKNVSWNLRNPGNLQLIKATGAISRNGTAKVYIEKDDERLLIFDSTKQLFDVNIEVLNAEAGTRCAGITAAAVALIDAGIPMRDIPVSCAAGKIDDTVVVDLGKEEDNQGSADLPVAIAPRTG